MWAKYDEDKSGHLDKEEARRFVIESIQGEDHEADAKYKSSDQIAYEERMTNKQFEACFLAVDEDKNGLISKDEMFVFLKLVSDIEEI